MVMASSSLFASLASAALLFALVPFVAAFHKPNVAVTCTSHSWWVLFPLDASIVDPWVPSEFPFMPASSLPAAFSSLPANQRMVTLEFNKQIDCFTKALPFVKTTFTEFKVQVPFLNAKNFANRAPLMYKPIIYADNLINAIGGSVQYGLKTVFAENMPYDVKNGLYTVNYDGEQIKGEFVPMSDWFPINDLSSSSFAHEYFPMHEKTEWLGHDVWGRTRCAKHYYKWDQTRIRWVNASIHFGEGMVGDSPAFNINVLGDQKSKFVTAFQIETVHDINNLEKCSIINPNIFNIYWESSTEHNRVFDVSEEKNENGTPLIMWNPHGGKNQKFEWVAGEQLRWVGTDKCLDVKDGNNVNGNVIFMWECARRNDNPHQKFVRDGHMIRWKDSNKCLGVVNGSTDAGARVAIYDCDENNAAQQFGFQS